MRSIRPQQNAVRSVFEPTEFFFPYLGEENIVLSIDSPKGCITRGRDDVVQVSVQAATKTNLHH